jgi:hypothetical protein
MAANGETSKKPSDANLPSPPEHLIFFIDRSLGRKVVPGALRAAGEEVASTTSIFLRTPEMRYGWQPLASKAGSC